jgi:pyruvate dehydrogenase E2 component (dihydrolipoamide acetyltransferase)
MSGEASGRYEFRMPSLGADMEAGTLTRWLVAPGDRVARGDLVAVVETEKADIDVEVFAGGVVDELLVAPGAKVPVGTPLARLRDVVETVAAPVAPVGAPSPARGAAPPLAAAPTGIAPAPGALAGEIEASPAARRRAAELGLDLGAIPGSGPRGAVVLADVEAAAGAARAPARGTRRALTAAMERSHREIPAYYLARRIDWTRAAAWLAGENARRPVAARLLPAALLLKSTALAARRAPELNGHWIDGAFRAAEAVDVGVAISRRDGEVVVPALHAVDTRPLDELMTALVDLVARARAGSLRSSELAGATITVTFLGELGADAVYGVIFPPQVALVGFGRIHEAAWAEAGRVEARPTIEATLAADHRASDGFRGGRFLAAIAELLEKPEAL